MDAEAHRKKNRRGGKRRKKHESDDNVDGVDLPSDAKKARWEGAPPGGASAACGLTPFQRAQERAKAAMLAARSTGGSGGSAVVFADGAAAAPSKPAVAPPASSPWKRPADSAAWPTAKPSASADHSRSGGGTWDSGGGGTNGAGWNCGGGGGWHREETVRLNSAIAAHAQRKELTAAVACFDELVASGGANSVSYGAVVHAHVRCGDVPGARLRIDEAAAAGLKPCVVAYTSLLKGYCGDCGHGHGGLAMAWRTLREMLGGPNAISSVGTAATTATVAAAAAVGAAAGKAPKRRSVQPNVRTVNTLLRGCLMFGDPDRGAQVMRELTTAGGGLAKPKPPPHVASGGGGGGGDGGAAHGGGNSPGKKKKKKKKRKQGQDGSSSETAEPVGSSLSSSAASSSSSASAGSRGAVAAAVENDALDHLASLRPAGHSGERVPPDGSTFDYAVALLAQVTTPLWRC